MEKVVLADIKKIPNILSLIRLLLVIPLIILFNNFPETKWFIILLGIIASILDNLDGYLARTKNQITELGKVVDPLADKIFIIVFAYLLYINNLIPYLFLILVIARDFLIMFAGIIFLKKIKRVPPSDFIGKLTVGAIGIVFIISLLEFQKIKFIYDLVIYIASFLIILSFFNYGMREVKNYYGKYS